MKPSLPSILMLSIMLLLVGLGALTANTARAAEPIRVSVNGATSGTCGGSWQNTCSLQYALSLAMPGDELWVAAGVYTPTSVADRNATFQLRAGVALYGGFATTETQRTQRDWETNVTVLSGDIDRNDIVDANGVVTNTDNLIGNNSYHVVSSSDVTDSAMLDGFVVTAGFGRISYPFDTCAHGCGGGMNNVNSSPTVQNVEFIGNLASYMGGAIYNADSSPQLTNVTLSSNRADYEGGGMYNLRGNPALSSVTFTSNTVVWSNSYGAGLYNEGGNPHLSNVIFTANRSSSYGGGMYNQSGTPTLSNVSFVSNTSLLAGGGMYSKGNPQLSNLAFTGNSGSSGGCMYNYQGSPALSTVSFTANTASGGGGGMVSSGGSPQLVDVTFTLNVAGTHYVSSCGGMSISGGNPSLMKVSFISNTANAGGGLCSSASSPQLSNVTFVGNRATYDYYDQSGGQGGGMYISSGSAQLFDATFTDNSAFQSGGGVDNHGDIRLTKVIFANNSAGNGGGMLNDANALLRNVSFTGNRATSGGGMFSRGDPLLLGVTFSGNTAAYYDGGGMFNGGNPQLSNVTFSENTAAQDGGGMFSYGSPQLSNVTFTRNTAGQRGGGIFNYGNSLLASNTILWGNAASNGSQVGSDSSGSNSIYHSVVQGGCPDASTCFGLVVADPLLGALGDYGGSTQTVPLLPGSSAMDAGNDALCPIADQREIPRPQGTHCDIGAFESRGFTLTRTTGDDQSTIVTTAFPVSLSAAVHSSFGEPLDGGTILFTAPPSGASTNPAVKPVAISNGTASTTVTANSLAGPYSVVANGPGTANSVSYALTNTKANTTTTLSASSNPANEGQPITLTFSAVINPPARGTVSGNVTVALDGGASLCTGPAVGGTCTLTYTNPTSKTLTASYPGEAGFFGSTSQPFTLVVNNLVPTVVSLSHTSSIAGSPGFTLIVTGTNFFQGSVVRWNGSPRTTTFVSSTQLKATILASDLTTPGTAKITVAHPAPAGDVSNAVTHTIGASGSNSYLPLIVR